MAEDNRNLFSHSVGGQKFKIKVSAGLVSYWELRRESRASLLAVGDCWILSSPWLRNLALQSLFHHHVMLFCCVCIPGSKILSSYKDTSHMG